ncbi:S1 family peptidase [Mycobacterium sp. NBC_00419]|uniref:Rv1815 family serine proteinase n=1 Tax=Mycobacterium sp. NBC_00419 TaxID=2975989 RepID=UPI0030DFF8B7
MARLPLRYAVAAALAAALCSTVAPAAQAEPGVVVYPGMEIHQDSNVCTLGYVDPVQRIAFSAGHCRGSGPVTDKDGRFIGMVSTFRDNTPDGSVVRTDEVISDYETIGLAADVTVNNFLPGGRQLVADPAPPMAVGQPVCHFGVITGESCGSIERVNNGWFTMNNGVVSKKGDSGGPVYMLVDNNKAVIVGLFNSTWGALPAAVSWQATGQQVREDVGGVVNIAASQQQG